ncbi:ATPase component of various ABC-type transport systems with duplicated ATPase domain [Sanguibacter keddieii DSM 10542]|uniref:ATPase component of various ABC-type transport systems with duplicated ATPase domain n=1 Tax=Sanguibacter keddieii (strain ATCC 51767 / DSM 10542 / NCFB 3025 / ST-74) TaxID=446469 RepID=D1BG20_SANKS|nr:ATP-binding cassette domain-containing protein [Sanguibacter keddieii]ACZ21531.1 ATPase component of various ABC-type transport systems with duplicated ATPase domain [Sanguibacter keddieii DSM 10542]
MITFDDVTLVHDDGRVVLDHVTTSVRAGELTLVAGGTGSGKSTLLAMVDGLVPHFSPGRMTGEVTVDGRSTRLVRPRDLADVVGYVAQNPAHGFVTSQVESELAFSMEQRGVSPAAMRRRVEETLDLVGLAELRDRPLRSLSLGQQQRVAIGAVLTATPQVLVLDEPTSALDPVGAEEVLAIVRRLVEDLGLTVVLAEHRLERVLHAADRVLYLPGDGSVRSGGATDLLRGTSSAPPILRLADALGWDPAPLTVRAARPFARELVRVTAEPVAAGPSGHVSGPVRSPAPKSPPSPQPRLSARRLDVSHGDVQAVRRASLDLAQGEVVALMGRNGSGKSSLLWALQGSGPRERGDVRVDGTDPARMGARRARELVALVPQDVSDLFFCETVDDECRTADADAGAPEGTTRTLLGAMVEGVEGGTHPRDLSEGQRLALALAVVLAVPAQVLLLDEPTRGLDYAAKGRLVETLHRMAADGTAVLVATHDVELAADLADRVVLMAQGEVVADGPAREMLTASTGFAPQVAKVFAPRPWVRLSDVPGLEERS